MYSKKKDKIRYVFLCTVLGAIFSFACTGQEADAFAPDTCSAIHNADLTAEMNYQFDSRLEDMTSSSGTINLWTTRGDGSASSTWAWNPSVWTSNGSESVDWTGVSPWNSDGGYNKAGVLVSPRHVAFAKHYQINTGATIIFIDANGNIISRTITGRSSLSNADITIGELDSAVPDSITYYPIVDFQILKEKTALESIPLVFFDAQDHLIIGEDNSFAIDRQQTWIASNGIAHSVPSAAKRFLFHEPIVGGDSGNPLFTIINNKPILLSTHTSVNGGPLYPAHESGINSLMSDFGTGYSLTEYDLSCFADIDEALAVNAPDTVSVDASTIQDNDIIAAFDAQNNKSLTSTSTVYEILSGNDDSAFLLTSPVAGACTLGGFNNSACYYTDGFLRVLDKSKLEVGTDRSLVIQASNLNDVTESFTVDVSVSNFSADTSQYQWTSGTGASGVTTVATSLDGEVMIGGKMNSTDYLYRSTDGGMSWTAIDGTATSTWYEVKISDDALTMYGLSGHLASSNDGGQTWAIRTSPYGGKDLALAQLTDEVIVMPFHADAGNYLVRTDNAGNTWNALSNAGNFWWWKEIETSDNGETIVFIDGHMSLPLKGFIHISRDGGQSWEIAADQGKEYWPAIAVSGYGQTIVAGEYHQSLRISHDAGQTWEIKSSSGQHDWTGIDISGDGQTIVAAYSNGVLVSHDGGERWQTQNSSFGSVTDVSISEDGNRIVVAQNYSGNPKIGVLDLGLSVPAVSISRPTMSSATTAWNPEVNWGTATTCQYSFSVSAYTSVTCSANGSDIPAPSFGTSTLHVRGITGEATSTVASVTFSYTATDTAAPEFSSIEASPSYNNATIIWVTDEAATSQIEYGISVSYGATTTLDSSYDMSHSQSLTGLSASTTYHYRIRSVDASGNVATSTDRLFTTTSIPDTNGPSISSTVAVSSTDSVIITWTTDETATSRVAYGTTESYGMLSDLNTDFETSHSVTISGLSPGITYYFKVLSVDISENTAESSSSTFSTLALPSTESDDTGGSSGGGGGKRNPKPAVSTNQSMPVLPADILAKQVPSDKLKPLNPPASFGRPLQAGAVGDDVRELQRFLNANGYAVASAGIGSSGNESDYFGPATQAALAKFQADHGIYPAIGYLGPVTIQEISSMNSTSVDTIVSSSITTVPYGEPEVLPGLRLVSDLKKGMSGPEVSVLQSFLISKNSGSASEALKVNGATGFFGENTFNALVEFQLRNGIVPASGYFGPKTRAFIK